MKKTAETLTGILFGLSLIVFLLLSSIDMNCFNVTFFEEQYRELNTAESLWMPQEDLMKATTTLLDYLRGDVDSIEVDVRINGVTQEAFNDREKAHMVDVRALYQHAMIVRWGALGGIILSLALSIVERRRHFLSVLSAGLLQVSVLFILFLCLLGVWIMADFNGFWTTFHQLFFTNDLWLLNPYTDLMINLFPEAFFNHLVVRIILWFLAFYVPAAIIALLTQRDVLMLRFCPGLLAKTAQRRKKS